MMKYGYRLLFLAALAGGVYLSIQYINPYGGQITLSEAILQLSGSRGRFVMGFSYLELISFTLRLFPAFIFEAYAGILLYRHFCTASIYVFSRYPYRLKWYMGEVFRLSMAVCVFNLLLLAVAVLTAAVRYELEIDNAGIVLSLYHFLIYALWEYIMALLVNLLAVYLGSSTAYASVAVIQLMCIVLLNPIDFLIRYSSDSLSYENLLLWNPAAHLVLGWHESSVESVAGVLTSPHMQFDLNGTLLILFLIGIVVTFVGALIIKKQDLLVSDLEKEAA